MAAEPTVPTEASRMRKHLKRAEANEDSSHPIESRTYGYLTVEIPVENSRRKRPHLSCDIVAHALPVPAAYRLLTTARSHLWHNSDDTFQVVDSLTYVLI
jgi:hypothetical protein